MKYYLANQINVEITLYIKKFIMYNLILNSAQDKKTCFNDYIELMSPFTDD